VSLVVAGSGHRPDKLAGGYSDATFFRLSYVANEALVRLGATRVISGMALGWDQALAHAAVELKIPLVAAVPFKGQEEMWPASSQKRYNDLLRQAESVFYVSKPPYAAQKMHARNEYMVNECDLLLVVWNGSAGGTSSCISYAKRMQKPIENMWDEWITQTERDRYETS